MNKPDIIKYDQGMVFWYTDDIDNKENGERGILRGSRPVMILSTVSNNVSNCIVTCLPLTTSTAGSEDDENSDHENRYFYKVPVQMHGDKKSYVCCNQPMNISTYYLRSYMGQCSADKFRQVQIEFLRYIGIIEDDIEKLKTKNTEITQLHAEQTDDEATELEECDDTIARFTFTRAVACLEDGLIFKNKSEAARYYNINRNLIRSSIVDKSTIPGIDKTFVTFKQQCDSN